MGDLHPTFEDKDRRVDLPADGQWQHVDFGPGGHTALKVDPGVYLVLFSLRGLGTGLDTDVEIAPQRYPLDPKDNGTAWNSVDPRRSVEPGKWFITTPAKIVIYAAGGYSLGAGIDVRAHGGRGCVFAVTSRVVKFLRQRDEPSGLVIPSVH